LAWRSGLAQRRLYEHRSGLQHLALQIATNTATDVALPASRRRSSALTATGSLIELDLTSFGLRAAEFNALNKQCRRKASGGEAAARRCCSGCQATSGIDQGCELKLTGVNGVELL